MPLMPKESGEYTWTATDLMKRILFLIVYAIALAFIWPGLLMGKCSACYPFPPLWLNVVILLGCILVFAAVILSQIPVKKNHD